MDIIKLNIENKIFEEKKYEYGLFGCIYVHVFMIDLKS